MEDYRIIEETLNEVGQLNPETKIEGSKVRKLKIQILKLMISSLRGSNEYQKLKLERQKAGDINFKLELNEEHSIPPAYGFGTIPENKEKIKELKKTLNELKEKSKPTFK